MKNQYWLYFLLMAVMALMHGGCSEGAIGDDFAETQYVARGSVVSAGNITGFFDPIDPLSSMVAFDLESIGETVNSVEVLASYNGVGDGVVGSASSVPSNVTIQFSDVLSALGVNSSSVKLGDNVIFAFDAVTSSGKYRSSFTIAIPVSCFSNIGGTHSFVSSDFYALNNPGACPAGDVTGTVTFTDLGGGNYHCSDLGFGQYGSSCWGDSPASSPDARFTDVCNELTTGGLDQYGLVYTWVIKDVSGPELSITWFNDYDDGGDVVITKAGGGDWPAIFTK